MELLFERALLPDGIARHVVMEIADDGTLRAIRQARPDAGRTIRGLVVNGMPNLHSHAFQRGMAGASEISASADNSFWGWRETMYRFVERLQPEDVAAIAAMAYVEMLEAGYTSVAEFHYLHHQSDGSAYPDRAAMSCALRLAAQQAGIRQLLLPCLYQTSGFGPMPLLERQRRFAHSTDEFLRLFEQLRAQSTALHTVGVALHSLRAVPVASLQDTVAALPPEVPIHIHISEQQREVDECLTFVGRRPIEFLLDSVTLSSRWCLVHATHALPSELDGLIQAGAVVGLCPTTEANLGDGRFPLDDFVDLNGRFGIGSDSQASIDPCEELRAAEYALRLHKQRRGLVSTGAQPHCGTSLYSLAGVGGAQALGIRGGELAAGCLADLVVIDTEQPQFAGLPDASLLDAHIFAPRPGAVRDVMVAGQWVVREGRHAQREPVIRAYKRSIEALLR